MTQAAKFNRGITLSAAGRSDEAKADLQSFIETQQDDDLLADALYELGLLQQADGENEAAADSFRRLIASTPTFPQIDDANYRLAWSLSEMEQGDAARQVLASLTGDDNAYRLEALALIGETHFQSQQYEPAIAEFGTARAMVLEADDTAAKLRDRDAERTRELILFRGGQSAAALGRHAEAIQWYDELRQRFPATRYLAELFYELAVSSRELGQTDEALQYFGQVAENYRDVRGARSRFMRGEIFFAERNFRQAIGEFQRLMFGYGSEAAPADIQPWQARAGFEAARCSELMASSAPSESGKTKAIDVAVRFYQYVAEKHPGHELAAKAAQRTEELK